MIDLPLKKTAQNAKRYLVNAISWLKNLKR